MKLDYNIMRNIMLVLEEMDYRELLTLSNYSDYPQLSNYNSYELVYAIQRMNEGGLISCGYVSWTKGETPKFSVSCLTWQGHQYLETIRNDSMWNDILQKVSIGVPIDTAIHSVAKLIGSMA